MEEITVAINNKVCKYMYILPKMINMTKIILTICLDRVNL